MSLSRIVGVFVVACVLFLFTFVFRFNTMAGALGGFDNDHFVTFAYAKQVQAGERPLQDFEGFGLQGAWPSLTYLSSAMGQQWLGNNLRSEALLTILGVALAAALTFTAARLVSGIRWALPATLVSVFVAPTLYNYFKVVVLASATLWIALYTSRPNIGGVVVGAAITAVAFLVRHDFAVYVAVGIVLGCIAAGDWRRAVRHCCCYVVITLALLTPTLIYVHHYGGLGAYFGSGLELSQREARRSDLSEWPRFVSVTNVENRGSLTSFFDEEKNGVAWLYYLARFLPLAALVAAWTGPSRVDRTHIRAVALAIAGMSALATPLLVRGNVAVRLGDVGPLSAILLAVVGRSALRTETTYRTWWWKVRAVAVVAVLTCTALSTKTVGVLGSQFHLTGLDQSLTATWLRAREVWHALGELPEAALASNDTNGIIVTARYLNRCTAPSDRIVMMTYQPEILPFAKRFFGAGRPYVVPGYVLGERYERQLVDRWRTQSVPLVLVEFEEFFEPTNQVTPVVRSYLLGRYVRAGEIKLGEKVLHVFVRRDMPIVSTFGSAKLPCPHPT